MKSNTEIRYILKKIIRNITNHYEDAEIWYGRESLAAHAYRKGLHDACREINHYSEILFDEIHSGDVNEGE